MSETIRHHILKITVATVCISLLFVCGVTWKAATAKAMSDARDETQDSRITSLETTLSGIIGEMKLMNTSLIQIKAVLGVSDIDLPRVALKQ